MWVVIRLDFGNVPSIQLVQLLNGGFEDRFGLFEDLIGLVLHFGDFFTLEIDFPGLALDHFLDVIGLLLVLGETFDQLLDFDSFLLQDGLQLYEFGLEIGDGGVGLSQLVKAVQQFVPVVGELVLLLLEQVLITPHQVYVALRRRVHPSLHQKEKLLAKFVHAQMHKHTHVAQVRFYLRRHTLQ